MSESALRVLVVDDTATYRKITSDVLASIADVQVVGTAPNGRLALQKIPACKPDLLTLDLEMPELDGLGVLAELQKQHLPIGAIMLSALTTDGADATVEALRLGAFDFVVKPTGQDAKANYQTLRSQLEAKIRAFSIAHCTSRVRPSPQAQAGRQTLADHAVTPEQRVRDRLRQCGTDLMVIGVSTGGPPALSTVLPALPASCAVPILVVQHMPPRFTKSLAEDLDQRCALSVEEASHGQPIRAGQILIAPGGKQMKIAADAKTMQVQLTDDPPENHCRPSVDYLFRSAAAVGGRRTIAIMMTGMGSDGLQGCSALHSRGAFIMAQDEASCVVYGMPKAVVDHQLADVVVPLHDIARHMTSLSKAGVLA